MSRQTFFLLLSLLLALGVACSFGGATAPTPTPLPTATSVPPTATPVPPTATPSPEPSPTATPAPALSLSDGLYEHPSHTFKLRMVKDWELAYETQAGAGFEAKDGSGKVEIIVVNTGFPLDADGLTAFADGMEEGFKVYDNYRLLDRQESDQLIRVDCAFTYQGQPTRVRSYYLADTDGPTAMSIQIWANEDRAEAYFDFFENTWMNEVYYDTEQVAQQIPYADTWVFTGPGDLFEMEVPFAWSYSSQEDQVSVIDRFDEPNGLAFIENIAYDDGNPISKSLAGKLALEILRQFYAPDLKVLDDQVQPDGSERLIWTSAQLGMQGITFFEVRNSTTFLLLSLVAQQDAFDTFSPLFSYILQTYTIP